MNLMENKSRPKESKKERQPHETEEMCDAILDAYIEGAIPPKVAYNIIVALSN